jgi:glycosyltransferase involved in cell wall biosynthesis
VIDIIYENLANQGHEVTIVAPRPGLRVRNNLKIPKKNIVWIPAIEGLFFDDYLVGVFSPTHTVRKLNTYNFDAVMFFTPAQVGLIAAYIAKRSNIPLIEQYCTDLVEYVKLYPSVLPGVLALSFSAPFVLKMNIKDVASVTKKLIKPPNKQLKWSQKTISAVLTGLHNSCDLVVGVSPKSVAQLKKQGVTAKVECIPTGVDKLQPNKIKQNKLKKKYKIEPRDKVVLFVGRLGEEKNLDLLLDAYEIVANKLKGVKLIFVGDFNYREHLEVKASVSKHKDSIIFTGRIPRKELGNIYGLADVFAFPSVTDTQALVLNEAAYAGLPIVWCDIDVNDVVKDKMNGILAKSTAKSFARAITNILGNSNISGKYSEESIRRAKMFSESKMTKKLISNIEALAIKY